MAKYHYNGEAGQSKTDTRRTDKNGWIIIALLLVVMPPIGILLLVLRLFSGERRYGQHPANSTYTRTATAPTGARTVRQTETAGDTKARAERRAADEAAFHAAPDRPTQVKDQGSGLIGIGATITTIFGFASLMTINDLLWYPAGWAYFIGDMVPLLCFLGAGVGLLWAGLGKRKKSRRYRKYLAMIGRRQTMSIPSLSQAMGLTESTVSRDLEDMLDEGILPFGYINYGGKMLVLSDDGLFDAPTRQEEKKPEVKEESQENAVLSEIRAVNDSIDNPKLSAQIDRIGIITAKIFDYQKKNPEKSPQLHSFLSYYLPTTLKILRAYAQLEDQDIDGSNINAAMQRIEGMMEKVVEGFEKQLDQLFQGDALDITTDVQVLERMLAKDGLSVDEGFRLEI